MTILHSDPRSDTIDLTAYSPENNDPATLFGLPQNVKFCKKCVISNQRPNSTVEYKHTSESRKIAIAFDDSGICDACRHAERKNQIINWGERDEELRDLCDRFRSRDGSYDCLVPGSGGKDSFYQSWILKNKYGMNPLTCTWAPHIYTDWGWRNFNRWIHSGFDNYLLTPNGRVKRLMTRLAVENILHPFQPFIVGQKGFAPKFAAKMGIPLIFYGENEAEYGNPLAENSSAQRAYDYFSTAKDEGVFFGGTSIQSYIDDYGLRRNELEPYMPANPEHLKEKGIQVHYLGYYTKWHPQDAYYHAVEHGGFEASPHRTPGTYSKYNSLDDKIDDFHYHTTYIKFGIGRTSYDAAQEVRSGDLERQEAVALTKRYDGEFPERFADEIFDYLSLPENIFPEASKRFESPIMDRAYYEALINRFRSPHLWQYSNDGWALRHTVFEES